MTEPKSSAESAPVFGGPAAAWLCGVLLFGMLLVAIMASIDRARLATLENFSETTAVGDHVYYALPSPLPQAPGVVARLQGQALMPVDYAKFQCRDSKMQPVARDPDTKLMIYEGREPLTDTDGGKLYFVKTAANEYLKLRAMK